MQALLNFLPSLVLTLTLATFPVITVFAARELQAARRERQLVPVRITSKRR